MELKNASKKIHTVMACFCSGLETFLERVFCRQIPLWGQLAELAAVKCLYIFSVILMLKDQWYAGYGSYGVVFVWWKEIIAAAVFLAVSALYLRFPIRNKFAGPA